MYINTDIYKQVTTIIYYTLTSKLLLGTVNVTVYK